MKKIDTKHDQDNNKLTITEPIIDQLVNKTTPRLKDSLTNSPNFIVRLWIAMHSTSQSQVNLIKNYLDTIPESSEIERSFQGQETQIETKADIRKIKTYIINPMNKTI